MKDEKFTSEVETVLKFIQLYCNDKHKIEKENSSQEVLYKGKNLLHVKFDLCPTCKETFLYTLQRLQECPHEEKPRCRKCPNPCYERPKWKELTRIMRHSGMKLGLLKIKKLFVKFDN
jgi:hypothetical protein